MVFPKNADFKPFLNLLNNTHANIKFTYEIGPSKIAFLDTSIELPSDNINSTCNINVYRKSTFTGLTLNFKAFCPYNWKLGIIYCFLHRAYNICSSFNNFHSEIIFLEKLFKNNGYPSSNFHSCVKKFLKNKFDNASTETKLKESDSTLTFCIPFIGTESLKLKLLLKLTLKLISV